LTELLKSAYCIIYSNKSYLVEFDKNFLASIINYFGKNAVKYDKEKEKLTILINSK
jgi:signal transduction histidine kinase